MAKPKKPNGNIGGTLGLVAGIVGAVTPLAVELIDRIPKKEELGPSEELIFMPELCSKKFPLKLDEAKELLESRGLKALSIEVRLRDACVKYKDCFELQVVGSDRKPNSKLKPGDTVIVQYVTQEVINESRRIFEEAEQQKAALKQERAVKRAEQMERAKAVAGDTAAKARAGVEKMIRRDKKKELGKESSHEQE
ncbi:hypothetical protein CE91St41_38910 [Oscillospiraceae bacterium]|jgi:hypothetical protein|uniref:hypothetical protein n=1 Tax=Pseudoflavonifractor phocaeensis TaxID=1870988 RepID=UPI0019563A1C|nr:hypothetical protein [Pseudoflavonifractor phocaeensis]MBM6886483.1 hypothetical protein [Pseudoflavonifractor phocaeensis]BDF72908.1 hypothetical protein CE91St40_38890 [Oscillospiraceae bacterium]BDF77002.1 hypothetical protein CE91St41_38910 [Oscillospiraceae bacterium]DAZ08673.1 MAG TPA: hypothetical protein [Caudoviricetes sp.]